MNVPGQMERFVCMRNLGLWIEAKQTHAHEDVNLVKPYKRFQSQGHIKKKGLALKGRQIWRGDKRRTIVRVSVTTLTDAMLIVLVIIQHSGLLYLYTQLTI